LTYEKQTALAVCYERPISKDARNMTNPSDQCRLVSGAFKAAMLELERLSEGRQPIISKGSQHRSPKVTERKGVGAVPAVSASLEKAIVKESD
jgi:hypothetical protein